MWPILTRKDSILYIHYIQQPTYTQHVSSQQEDPQSPRYYFISKHSSPLAFFFLQFPSPNASWTVLGMSMELSLVTNALWNVERLSNETSWWRDVEYNESCFL